jgi:hypothetical protein
MSKSAFRTIYCDGYITKYESNKNDLRVEGVIHEGIQNNTIYYFAASPPDYRATYTGSGLPFANAQQAFDNTPNKGNLKLLDGTFQIDLMFPNAYYTSLGTVCVPPTLYISYTNNMGKERNVSIKLSEGIPYRSLTYHMKRKDAMFYGHGWSLPVRTQEQILRDSDYPSTNQMPNNFWGLRPPL